MRVIVDVVGISAAKKDKRINQWEDWTASRKFGLTYVPVDRVHGKLDLRSWRWNDLPLAQVEHTTPADYRSVILCPLSPRRTVDPISPFGRSLAQSLDSEGLTTLQVEWSDDLVDVCAARDIERLARLQEEVWSKKEGGYLSVVATIFWGCWTDQRGFIIFHQHWSRRWRMIITAQLAYCSPRASGYRYSFSTCLYVKL